MKSAKTLVIFTFLLAVVSYASAQMNKSTKSQSLRLSANDKIEIINQVFNDGFEKLMEYSDNFAFRTCLIPLVEGEKVIFISTEIEKPLVNPKFEGYRFMVMSVPEMGRQVRKEKGECYFRLTPFIVDDSKVKITLARYYNLPGYVHGIGFKYEFERVNGKWERRLLGNYRIDS